MLTVTIILLVVFVILSAFFSGAEVALVSLNDLKVRQLVEQKAKNSRLLFILKQRPRRMLITILIGNNVVNIASSALATKLALQYTTQGVGLATGVMTFVLLTFGEIAPKTFCSENSKRVSLSIAPIILFLSRLLAPLVWFFLQISRLLERISGKSLNEPLVTEEEVRDIVKIGEEEGQIKSEEKEMIQKIFLFDDTEVEDVMTPRTDMFALDWTTTLHDAMDVVLSQEFSRIPVFEDVIDKIKGIVFTRELLEKISRGEGKLQLKDIMQQPLYVPEHKKIDKLLKELQKKKTHMAIVVNEHGGIEGLITIEDVLEEIVGEIFDESDDVEKLIKSKGKNLWSVLGKTPIDELNQELKLLFSEDEEYNTIAGLIQHRLGHIPTAGEECFIKKQRVLLKVIKVEGPVILLVHVKKLTHKEVKELIKKKGEEQAALQEAL